MVADRLRAGLRCSASSSAAPTALVAAGGVAANEAIRKVLHRLAFEAGTVLVAPPPELCTDNGAMIAWAGAERLALGLTDTLDAAPRARWPLAEVTPPRRRPHAETAAAADGCMTLSSASRCVGAGAWGTALANAIGARRTRRDALRRATRPAPPQLADAAARARVCPASSSMSASP